MSDDRDDAQLVTAILKMAVDLAEDQSGIDATLKANLALIRRLGEVDPDRYDELKIHTQARRANLQRQAYEKHAPLTRQGIPSA